MHACLHGWMDHGSWGLGIMDHGLWMDASVDTIALSIVSIAFHFVL
jgi:hypothetical protein